MMLFPLSLKQTLIVRNLSLSPLFSLSSLSLSFSVCLCLSVCLSLCLSLPLLLLIVCQ